MTELEVVDVLKGEIPKWATLFCSNSLPIRLMDANPPKNVRIGYNRGASGIDGILATALGFGGDPLYVLIGDLAMLHDLNSLALVREVPLAQIIVLNNNGGGIFARMPIAHSPYFETYFKTPHGFNFRSAAEMFGLGYSKPKTASEFKKSLKSKISSIIEVMLCLIFMAGVIHAKPMRIAVSILPQVEFVKSIGKERVDVFAILPAGAGDDGYEPTPRQISLLGHTRLYIRIGHLPFEEANIKKFRQLNPSLKIVDSSTALSDDPHTWMSVRLVKGQVGIICKALSEADPNSRAFYQANRDAYLAQLDQLDKRIAEITRLAKRRHFLIFHPFLGYFAKDYGFEQSSIEFEGKSPTPRQLQSIVALAKKEEIKAVLVQRQFGRAQAQAVADAIGGKVIEIDPLSPNYLSNMEKIARVISEL